MVKPKLTPEEKKALRLQKKQEKKLQAIERKKQLKRDYLLREIRYSDQTVRKYEQNWRQMLINISLPNIRNELQFAWHNFEHIIDCKDFKISFLMDELRDAQEQYMMNFRNHLQNIENLIDIFYARSEELQNNNQKQVRKLREEMREDIENSKKASSENEEYLKTMLYGMEMQKKNQAQTLQVDFFLKTNELETEKFNSIQRLKGFLEEKYYTTWNDTKNFYNAFKKQTLERRKSHDELKQQDDFLQQVLVKQLKKLDQNFNYLIKLRQNHAEMRREREDMLKQLNKSQKYYENAFTKMRKILKDEQQFDFNKLLIMTTKFNETIKYLTEMRKKGKCILQLNSVCKKLETIQEKILPFPTTSYSKEKKTDDALAIFWQKFGLIEASKYAINEERLVLQKENDELKSKLRELCKCARINEI